MKSLAVVFAFVLMSLTSQAHALYTPQEALQDAMSDNLVFVGKWIPTYSESGKVPVCVFRGDKVVVFINYCLKDKIPAFGSRIHSLDPDKGFVSFYAEVEDGLDITKEKRNAYYEVLWRISARRNGPTFAFDGDTRKMRNFDEGLAKNALPDCIVSYSNPLWCNNGQESHLDTWGTPATAFRKSPGQEWYNHIKKMVSLVP